MEWVKGSYIVTCDPSKINFEVVASFLADSYWAKGIPPETVQKSLSRSLCFSLLHSDRQAGLARVVSDYATFAYVGDVFVLQEHRGKGLSKWLMQCVLSHPELQGLRRWILATRDAHGLYKKFGFVELARPEIFMERHDHTVYTRGKS